MKLEALATRQRSTAALTDGWRIHADTGADGAPSLVLDLLPLARHLAEWPAADGAPDPVQIASLWHATLAAALADWLRRAMAATGLGVVALGGGCCANRALLRGLTGALQNGGCTPLTARALPTGDDAISYGQAWVAMERLGDTAS